MSIQSLCVYCGSSDGSNHDFKKIAYQFGKQLAQQSIQLVYGGGSVGLMGAVADGALSENGEVIGVIPQTLNDYELGHKGLTKLHVVRNMHERKQLMAELSDAFVTLPGGIGTLEELFEIYTWKQLNFHQKPCAILNVDGYYDLLIQFLKNAVKSDFLKQDHLDSIIIDRDPLALLKRITQAEHKAIQKWF